MTKMIDTLERMNLSVIDSISNGEEWELVCRTKNENLVIISYKHVESFENLLLYKLIVYNSTTTNCFQNREDLLEALKNYLQN